ncbi:MAG TPA: hypothetical protein VH877_29710 [Polyangia bacterium]|nr:hypothetical protein [Polyangia bacterium]
MRRLVQRVLVAVTLLAGMSARADSRFSFELGGLYSYSPLSTGGGKKQTTTANGETRPANSDVSNESTTGTGSGGTTVPGPSNSIVGFEVRPSFFLAGGLRIGVGFRAGRTAAIGGKSLVTPQQTSLLGGDLSVGFGRTFGRLLPFAEARFGFNRYDKVPTADSHVLDSKQQLRLDAVVGARLYLSRSFFLLAEVFAGLGDRYGGSLALGFDVVHYRWRGRLP